MFLSLLAMRYDPPLPGDWAMGVKSGGTSVFNDSASKARAAEWE